MKNSIKSLCLLLLTASLILDGCKKDQSESESSISVRNESLPAKFTVTNVGLDVVRKDGAYYLQGNNSSVPISGETYTKLCGLVKQYQVPASKQTAQATTTVDPFTNFLLSALV